MRYLICLLALSFLSFHSGDINPTEENLLGAWVQTSYADKTYTFKKANKLDKNRAGIQFKSGGKLTKRQNVGWCGTPPITYGNNDGEWSQSKDGKIIDLQYQFWGGTATAQWEVVEISGSRLSAKVLEFSTEK